jgi:hypothetical protein
VLRTPTERPYPRYGSDESGKERGNKGRYRPGKVALMLRLGLEGNILCSVTLIVRDNQLKLDRNAPKFV